MSGRRLIVVESNEVPPRLFQWYADHFPTSAIARLVGEGGLHETVNHDESDLGGRELYPSQTWATLGTGVAFADHGVYWYGDPKPAEFPLYWQLAARAGKRVGIVGTLHSSPFVAQSSEANIAFAIPDCFAPDAFTRPARYEAFQRMNLAMTRGSGRVVATRPGPSDLATVATSWRLGVRPRTLTELARLGANVARGRAPRERLRTAQFLMQADIFEGLVRRHDPDLAVLFTNHVASMMHRYWFALFPEDWASPAYDDAWIARYRHEIPHAMGLLDRALGELLELCDATDRSLLVVTSMGQKADTAHVVGTGRSAIVRDAERFVATLSSTHVAVLPGMVPQISVVYENTASATDARVAIEGARIGGGWVGVDQAAEVLTLTCALDADKTKFSVNGRVWRHADAGVEVQTIDDHRSGTHDPIGSMLVHGLDLAPHGDEPIDVRRVAPTVLDALGVTPPAHHLASANRAAAGTSA
jgi:hypothetical protein